MSAWLDAVLGRIKNAGTDIALGFGINFNSGLRARLNPSTKFIDVDLRESAVAPEHLAPATTGFGVVLVKRVAFDAGVTDGPDDVEIMLDAPFNFRIEDVVVLITTADAGGSLQLRSEPDGDGSALSSAMLGDSTGTVRNDDTETRLVVTGGNIYLRRSTDLIEGEVVIYAERT